MSLQNTKQIPKNFSEVNLDGVDLNALLELADNKELIENVFKRLQFGAEKYRHGVNVDTNTKTFNTDEDSWLVMALEEALDQSVYLAASIIRLKRELSKRGLPS